MNSILVTGATGFIGKALTARLAGLGFKILEMNSKSGDIADKTVFSRFENENINHVFHLAGKIFVPDSWVHPYDFYQVNVMGTGNVLEFCRRKSISLTYVGAYIYGQPEKLPIAEKARVLPNNPYAHSKYMAEQLCGFYAKEYHMNIIILRPFNVYGIGQNVKFLIPSILMQALHSDSIKVKDLNPKRDYLYMEDFIDALILTMDKSVKSGSIYNIGSQTSMSVREIIQAVQDVLGTHKPVHSENISRKNELNDVVADITMAKQELKWSPRHSFREGISEILDHYQIHKKKN